MGLETKHTLESLAEKEGAAKAYGGILGEVQRYI